MRRCSQEATLLLKAGFHTSRWKDIERIICYDYWALTQLVERFWGQKEGDVNILGKAMLFHFVFWNFRKAVYSAYLRFFQQCLISRTGSVTKQFESGFAMAAFPLLGYSWLQQTSRHIQRQDGRWGTTRVVFNILDCSLCWHQHSCCIGN